MIVLGMLCVAFVFWIGWKLTDKDTDPSVGWWSNYLRPSERRQLRRERRKALRDGNHQAVGAIDWMFGLDRESRRTHNKRREYTE